MSFVTLEQETLVVMTELADEEITGVVGGGYDFYAKKIDIDVDNKTSSKSYIKGDNNRVAQSNQTAVAIAFGGNAYATNKSSIDQSADRAYVWGH